MLKNLKDQNVRDYALVKTVLGSGARLQELVALNRNDLIDGNLRIYAAGKERNITLNNDVLLAIESYLEQRSDEITALFLSNRHERINPRTIQHLLQQNGTTYQQIRITGIKNMMDSEKDK